MSYTVRTQDHFSQIQKPAEGGGGGEGSVGFMGHLNEDELIEITVKSSCCAVGDFQVLI